MKAIEQPLRAILRYGIAPVAMAAAFGLTRTFLYLHWGQTFVVFSCCAIAITFWYGGVGPGVLATLLAAVIRIYLPDLGTTGTAAVIGVLLLYAVLMIQATRARDELEDRVAERTSDVRQANEHLRREIAQHTFAEQRLKESETHLAEAQRIAHVGSWVWGVQGREAVYLSEEWFRIYGFDPKEGFPNWEQRRERVHPEDRVQWQSTIERAIAEKSDYEMEFRILLPTGTVKHIRTFGHPVTNGSGDLVEFIGAAMDVTERRRAEEERQRLLQLEADLAHINRVSMMGELAASLAHEIKQPIAAAAVNAKTGLRWLQREPPDIEEARKSALRTVQDVNRAAEIIERNRSLYKGGTPEREVVNLNELIQQMVAPLGDAAHGRRISIHTELDAALASTRADRVQVQQVLMNLVLNGIEAMKNTGGELIVRSQKTEDGHVLVSVSDSGVGLPVEDSDRIFEAFFTTKQQGTGMGLSISRRIIESHGGRLWAVANSGRGATFQFTLPVEAAVFSTSAG
jgi:PAS domain S-box-containing protein